MKKLYAVAVPIVVVLFAGCGSLRPPLQHLRCDTPGVCKVTVTVTNCMISVDQDPIDVYGPNRNIQWEIDSSSNYMFDQKYGILIKDDPGGEFTNPVPHGKKFAWNDNNSKPDAKPFEYGINVRDGSGQLCHPVDPGIINHG